MEFAEAKARCADLVSVVEKLYNEKSTSVIIADINEFAARYPERMVKSRDKYILDERIELRIVNGCLQIIDDRGTAFLWLFEITSDIYRGDAVIVNGKPGVVRELTDEALTPMILSVNGKIEESIQILRNTGIAEYRYYSDHEDIEVETLAEVIDTVMRRKPVVR